MKKLFLLLVINIVTLATTFAKNDTIYIKNDESISSKVSNAIDSTKQSAKEAINTVDTSSNFKLMYNDVKSALNGMASALKVGSEHIYKVLVKQQIVNSVIWLVMLIISIIGLICMFKFHQYERKNDIDLDEEFMLAILYIGGWILTILIFLVTLFHIDNLITGFINPEYGALKDIFDFLKK